MAEPKPLVINAPRQGIAPSPMVGFGNMQNIDIYSVPGIAKLNNILEKKSATTVDAQIKWIVKNPASPANIYAIDSNGSVYTSANTGLAWTEVSDRAGAGQGLAVWKDHLVVFEETAIDLYGPLSGTPLWKNNWQTIDTDNKWHPAIVSKLDSKLYFGAGKYVGSINAETKTTFAITIASPGVVTATGHGLSDGDMVLLTTSGALPTGLLANTIYYVVSSAANTFELSLTSGGASINTSGSQSGVHKFEKIVFTAQALTLPDNYRIKCLAEQGNNLMIGTWMGINIYDNKIADIFLWDGSSATYGNPIILNENGVNAMTNINGYLYIMAGISGVIYKSNGAQAWVIGQIPLSSADISAGKYLEPYPGAIMSFKSKLFFGIGSQSTAGMGVYSLQENSQGNIVNFEHFISEETTGGTNPLIIGALLGITRNTFLCGWRNHATYGIDLSSPTSYLHTTAYGGGFESPLYQVGTHLIQRQFSQLEFFLSKELAASEGIRIKFRVNLTDSWTTIGTYTTTEIGAGETSFNTDINIPACEQLQIKVEFLGTATTTPEFRYLTLN